MADPNLIHPLRDVEKNAGVMSDYVNNINIPGVNLTEDDRRDIFGAMAKAQSSAAYTQRMDAIHQKLAAANPHAAKMLNDAFSKINTDVNEVGRQGDIKALTPSSKDKEVIPPGGKGGGQQPSTPPPPSPGYWNALNRGVAEELSQLDRYAANIVGMVPGAGGVSKKMLERSQEVGQEAGTLYGPEPYYITEKIAHGLGSGATGLIRHALGTSWAGPIAGPFATEIITHMDEGTPGIQKAAAKTAAMLLGFGIGRKLLGPVAQSLVKSLPAEYSSRLPANFADLVAGSAGATTTGQASRLAFGEPTSPSEAISEFVLGLGIPFFHGKAKQVGGKGAEAARGWFGKKETPAPPSAEAPPPTAKPASAGQKYQLTPDASGVVVDPYTKQSIKLEPNETAYHVGDTTYIVTPTGVPNSYKVSEGANRKHITRVGGVQSPEALALNIHAGKSSQPGWTGQQPKGATPPKPSTAPPPQQASTQQQKTATQQPAAESAGGSGTTSSIRVKKGGTAVIEFETEEQRQAFDAVNNYRDQSKGGVHPSEAVKKAFDKATQDYADQHKVSTDEAQKALQAWANSVFYGAEKQVPPGGSASVKAKGIPAPKPKKGESAKKTTAEESATPETTQQQPFFVSSATATTKPEEQQPAAPATPQAPVSATTTPPPPVVKVEEKPTKPAAATQPEETQVAPTTEAPPAVAEVKTQPPVPPKVEPVKPVPPAVEPPKPVAAAPAAEPVKPVPPATEVPKPKSTAAQTTEKVVAKPEETEAVSPTQETEVATPPPSTDGKYRYSFRKGVDLAFADLGDLAIGVAAPNKRSLVKHANKLGMILVDGRSILSNPDLAINLMRGYKRHLLDIPAGNAPSIADYAKNQWPDRAKVSIATSGSLPTVSPISSQARPPATESLTARETLDRVKFLRSMISTYEKIISGESTASQELNNLKQKEDSGAFAGAGRDELYILKNDLESTKPGGSINASARAGLAKGTAELGRIMSSPAGQSALELEASMASEQAAQQQRIKEASERIKARGGPRPIPELDETLVPKAKEGTPAAEAEKKLEATVEKAEVAPPTLSEARKIREKVRSAEAYVEDDSSLLKIRNQQETIKRAFIQRREIEIQGQKQLIADLSQGKLTQSQRDSLSKEKIKLESLQKDLDKRRQELSRYQKDQVAEAKSRVEASKARFEELKKQYEELMSRLGNNQDPKERKAIEESVNKGRSTLIKLEDAVKILQDKFMERTRAAAKEAGAPQSDVESVYLEAVDYAKDKGTVSVKDLRKALAKRGLSNTQVKDIHKRMIKEGFIDKVGAIVEKAPEEPKPIEVPKTVKSEAVIKPPEPAPKPPEREPATIKIEAPVKEEPVKTIGAKNFSSPEDFEIYQIWQKNPKTFNTADNTPSERSVIAEYTNKFRKQNTDLNRQETNRYIGKYMKYVEEQVKTGSKVKTLSEWYKGIL